MCITCQPFDHVAAILFVDKCKKTLKNKIVDFDF